MPTYEYECTACSHAFEKFQHITAKPLRKCPVCGGRLRRLIGAGAGVIFRGSGFYETDYKRKRSENTKSAEESAGANTDKTGKKPPKQNEE